MPYRRRFIEKPEVFPGRSPLAVQGLMPWLLTFSQGFSHFRNLLVIVFEPSKKRWIESVSVYSIMSRGPFQVPQRNQELIHFEHGLEIKPTPSLLVAPGIEKSMLLTLIPAEITTPTNGFDFIFE